MVTAFSNAGNAMILMGGVRLYVAPSAVLNFRTATGTAYDDRVNLEWDAPTTGAVAVSREAQFNNAAQFN